MLSTTKSYFSEDEDKKLKRLVEKHGPANWYMISKQMKNRNPRQCKDRWEKFLAPNINRKPYTDKEDYIIYSKNIMSLDRNGQESRNI